jgi:hypothetical protein
MLVVDPTSLRALIEAVPGHADLWLIVIAGLTP